MTVILTFVIPVRHQDNCHDWKKLKANLKQTILSISKQTQPNWRAIIVANEGADIPLFPDQRVEVLRVDFPANQLYKKDGISDVLFYDSARLDKGRRVLSGMIAARNTRYFMVVDDDDLISNKLVEFLSHQQHTGGWKVKEGYVWSDGGKVLLINRNFHHLCGSSLIINSDLYRLPRSVDEISSEEIKELYGSHVTVIDFLQKKGVTLLPIPFRAAIYRVGYSGSHSQAPKLFNRIFNKKMILRPIRLISHLLNLRLLTSTVKNEFF